MESRSEKVPTLPTPKSSGARWSKDSVEHIRTVHFSLAAICLALLVLSTSVGRSDLDIASEQIRDIADASQRFQHGWLYSIAVQRAKETLRPSRDVFVKFRSDATATCPAITPNCKLDPNEYAQLPSTPVVLITRSEMNDYEKQLAGEADSIPFTDLDVYQMQSGRLDDFKKLWERLNTSLTVYRLTNATIANSVEEMNFSEDGKMLTTSRSFPAELVAQAPPDFTQVWQLIVLPNQAKRMGPYAYGFGYTSQSQLNNLPFVRAASLETTPLNAQEAIVKQFKGWREGTFRSSFRELDDLTSGLQHDSIDELSKWLNERRTKESSSTLEVFNVKFPSESARRWGAILLLVIQAYFWLVIKEISSGLPSDNRGLDVAWIGFYSSIAARSATFISIVLMPATAIAFLGIAPIVRMMGPRWVATVAAQSLGSFFVFAICLALGIMTWSTLASLRSKISMEDPSQAMALTAQDGGEQATQDGSGSETTPA